MSPYPKPSSRKSGALLKGSTRHPSPTPAHVRPFREALLPAGMPQVPAQVLEQGRLVGKPGFSEGQEQQMPPEDQALCEPKAFGFRNSSLSAFPAA